jgi:hypothetical protein
VVINPAIPTALEGVRVKVRLPDCSFPGDLRHRGRRLRSRVHSLNGVALPFPPDEILYRSDATEIPMWDVRARLVEGANRLRIQVGKTFGSD